MKYRHLGLLVGLAFSYIAFSHAELSDGDRQLVDEELSSIPQNHDFYILHGPELNKTPNLRIYAEKNRKSSPVIELKNSVFWIQGKPTCRLFSPNGLEFVFSAITPTCTADAASKCENPQPCPSLQTLFFPFGRQGVMHAIPVEATDSAAGFAEIAQTQKPQAFAHRLFLDLQAWSTAGMPHISPHRLEAERKKEAATFANDAGLKKWLTDTRDCYDKKDLKCITTRFGKEIDPSQIMLFSWNEDAPFTCAKLNAEKKKKGDRKLRFADVLPCLWNTPRESLTESERETLDAFDRCLTPEAANAEDVGQLRVLGKNEILIHNACTLERDAKGEYRFKEFSGYGC